MTHQNRIKISKSRLSGELHHRCMTIMSIATYLDKAPDTIKQWNRIGWPEKYYNLMIEYLGMDTAEAELRLAP